MAQIESDNNVNVVVICFFLLLLLPSLLLLLLLTQICEYEFLVMTLLQSLKRISVLRLPFCPVLPHLERAHIRFQKSNENIKQKNENLSFLRCRFYCLAFALIRSPFVTLPCITLDPRYRARYCHRITFTFFSLLSLLVSLRFVSPAAVFYVIEKRRLLWLLPSKYTLNAHKVEIYVRLALHK